MTDFGILLRLAAGILVLWIFPWLSLLSGSLSSSTWSSRIVVAALCGMIINVYGGYMLGITGLYTPLSGLICHLAISTVAIVFAIRRRNGTPTGGSWTYPALLLGTASLLALFLRLPDSIRNTALGGNDPWGHLVLVKVLEQGDMIAPFHYFSYYPRGFHFLTLTISELTAVSPYDFIRLGAPLLAILTVIGAFAIVRMGAGIFGGLTAAFIVAIPPYRHLTLAALQTTMEPDRFIFALIPGFIILSAAVLQRASIIRYLLIILCGIGMFLIHPLSTQFTVTWMVLMGISYACITHSWKSITPIFFAGVNIILAGLAYYHIIHSSFGLTPMSHLAPRTAITVGGYGIDWFRLILGTGWYLEPIDAVAAVMAIPLLIIGWKNRSWQTVFIGLMLVHATWAATRDAGYIGDFGHAPPYYAMTFAWAAGILVGLPRLHILRWVLPPLLFITLLGRWIIWGHPVSTEGIVLIGIIGLLSGIELLLPYTRGYSGPLAVGLALLALRPIPISYARLGYPEAVEWARSLPAEPRAEVYSIGLLSKLPDGTPFPTQNPVRSIVWPTHSHRDLDNLLQKDPKYVWPPTKPCYVFLEIRPYRWGFAYFQEATRDSIMKRTAEWLEIRKSEDLPVRILAATDRMELIALHERQTQ